MLSHSRCAVLLRSAPTRSLLSQPTTPARRCSTAAVDETRRIIGMHTIPQPTSTRQSHLSQPVIRRMQLGVRRLHGLARSRAYEAFHATPADESRSPQSTPHLLLLDAHPWVYRCHFGFKSNRLRNSAGLDTSIAFGLMTYVLNMLEMEPTVTHMAAVFDSHGMSFRHELFSGYKSQRPPTPPEIVEALPQVQRILQSMGIPVLKEAGVEADDVVGALALRAHGEGMMVSIASPDKDFQQLLRPNLRLVRPDKKVPGQVVPYTVDDFAADYEGAIEPSQFIDILALAGDASDGVPGVRGIGQKIALQLISEYGSVESVIEHASEVKRKNVREGLSSVEGIATARLSKELVTIRTDLSLPGLEVSMAELELPDPSRLVHGAAGPFAELEFKSLMARLEGTAASLSPS